MAGIVGIVFTGEIISSDIDSGIYTRIMNALKNDNQQVNASYYCDSVFVANALPISKKVNDRLIINHQLGVVCAIDGFINLASQLKADLCREYTQTDTLSDHLLLPYLYRKYGESMALHITGSFNLFIYDIKANKALILNDRFGFFPIFYFHTSSCFIFASKIECILASGLLNQIEFDQVTIAEHLFFNYPVSENTYVKQIKTIPNANVFTIDAKGIKTNKYWRISDDYSFPPLSKRESFDLIDTAFSHAIETIFCSTADSVNLSLTGGWDSRVALAYMLPRYRDRLNCYSFGSTVSPDISIPLAIADKEKLSYQAFILDEEYLDSSFANVSKQTIELSGGARNYKRAHYLYALQKMGLLSDTLITGIFGDEVLKVGRPQGGTVLSRHVLAMLDLGFNPEKVLKYYTLSSQMNFQGPSGKKLLDGLYERIAVLHDDFTSYSTQADKYIAFRFEINLRKYFGNEASSYNDYVYCHSPFTDYNFVKAWLKTIYAGNHYDFASNRVKDKKMSIDLYSKLVMKRHPALAKYPSSRGFSMADTRTLIGNIKILKNKYISKRNVFQDGYNTAHTDSLFENMLKTETTDLQNYGDIDNLSKSGYSKTDALSLTYWMKTIQQRYT